MKSESEEELRNFFGFLAYNSEYSNLEKMKAEELAFGVDCYLTGLSDEAKLKLKEQIYDKAKDQMISYEDFKNLWITNLDIGRDVSTRDATNEIFNLISEYLGKGKLIDKITRKDLETLIHDLEIPITSKLDEKFESQKEQEILDNVITEMIECVSDNSESISKKEFELIMMEYLLKK